MSYGQSLKPISEISIYTEELTPKGLVENIAKIKKSFPELDKEFFDMLSDAIKRNNFGDIRLSHAVNNVIDNCVYPRPTIAQFISYDVKIKLKTIKEYRENPEYYKAVDIGISRPMFATVYDIERYKLKLWESKKL